MATDITKQDYKVSFVMGAYNEAQLKGLTQGSIAITTDEQALYVKTTSDETMPIRIGQIVTYANLTAFNNAINGSNPPYSTEGFYYIAEENALLKYVVTGGDYPDDGTYKGTWKQINKMTDIGDLSQTVTDLSSGLAAAQSDININKTNIATNVSDIAANKTAIDENKAAIALKADATTVTSLSNTVDALSKTHAKDKEALEGSISAVEETANKNKTDLEALSANVTNLTAEVNTKVDKTTYNSAIENINTEIGKKVDQSAYNIKIKALEDADNALTGTVNDLINDIGNLSNIMNFRGVATTSDGKHFTVTDGKGDFKLGDVVVVTSGDYSGQEYVCITEGTMGAEGSAVFEEIGSTKATDAGLAALQQTVSDLTAAVDTKVNKTDYDTAISGINEKVSSLEADKVDKSTYNEKIAALEKADSDLNSSVSSKAEQAALESGLAEKVAQSDYDTKVADFEKRISANTTAVTTTLPDQITNAIDNALAWGTF